MLLAALLLSTAPPPPDPAAGGGFLPAGRRWPTLEGVVQLSGGPEVGPVATAACVGVRGRRAYLLTANHAVPRGEGRAFEFYTRGTYPTPARTVFGSDIVLRLPGPDVALVEVTVGGSDPIPVLPIAPPGRRPKRFPAEAVSVGCPGGSPPVFRKESIIGKKWVRREAVGTAYYWEMGAAAVGGMSGGPLLDENGSVIGVCAATQDGRGYFAHLDEILAGLNDAGFGWLYATEATKP